MIRWRWALVLLAVPGTCAASIWRRQCRHTGWGNWYNRRVWRRWRALEIIQVLLVDGDEELCILRFLVGGGRPRDRDAASTLEGAPRCAIDVDHTNVRSGQFIGNVTVAARAKLTEKPHFCHKTPKGGVSTKRRIWYLWIWYLWFKRLPGEQDARHSGSIQASLKAYVSFAAAQLER